MASRTAEGSLDRIVTARKAHRCDGYICRGEIKPGDRYLRTALPPRSDHGNVGWWVLRICAECHPAANKEGTPQ